MTVQTGGPVRGFISRWLVRFEASQQIFRLVFLAVTAASTFTSALALLGLERFAPYVLGVGVLGAPIFAFGYVESGVYNRKNRERMDRGDNFAAPGMAMGNLIQARQFAALARALKDDDVDLDDVDELLEGVTLEQLQEFRDGIDVVDVYDRPRARQNGQEANA